MAAQPQAEFLLERSINRYRGANEEILVRAHGWLGAIQSTPRLESLFRLAINPDDMRVREAAIEINAMIEPQTCATAGRARAAQWLNA